MNQQFKSSDGSLLLYSGVSEFRVCFSRSVEDPQVKPLVTHARHTRCARV